MIILPQYIMVKYKEKAFLKIIIIILEITVAQRTALETHVVETLIIFLGETLITILSSPSRDVDHI